MTKIRNGYNQNLSPTNKNPVAKKKKKNQLLLRKRNGVGVITGRDIPKMLKMVPGATCTLSLGVIRLALGHAFRCFVFLKNVHLDLIKASRP